MDEGNKAGPYRVVRRYRGAIGVAVGRIYEAYNDDTGAPALVVTPGKTRDWWPRGDWKLTLTSSASPPQLGLEVTEGLREEDLVALPEELTRLVAGVGDVSRRPDGVEHLVGRRGQQRRGRASVLSGRVVRVAAAAAAVCMLAVVAGVLAAELRRPAQVLREAAAAEEPSGFTFTGGQLMAPMPAQPFARQKRPPCSPQTEEELSGGCWSVLEARAPCPANVYERGAKCYLPALAEAPPGRSVEP